MESFDIEISSTEGFLEGYWPFEQPLEMTVLDAIVEAMQFRENYRYIRHIMHHKFIPDGGFKMRKDPYRPGSDALKINTGTLKILARVYIEKR